MRTLAILLTICGTTAAAQSSVEAELRQNTQALLDAIAPGDTATWNRLLDPRMIQVDENDVVRTKDQILANLEPLGPGLVGRLAIDDFRVALAGDAAVVTHEDDEYLEYHGQVIKSRFRMTDTWVHAADGWRLIGEQELAVLKDPPAMQLGRATLCGYAGRYALVPDIVQTIRCEDDRLIVSREGRPDRTFLPESPDVFFEPGAPRTRRMFQRDAHGRVTGFVDRREARDVVWKRVQNHQND
jgi:uncharacterized protein DUF4440